VVLDARQQHDVAELIGRVRPDLIVPTGLIREEAIAYNERTGRGDGVERVDADGTVHFTDACREAVSAFGPHLAEPLAIGETGESGGGAARQAAGLTRREFTQRYACVP